MSTHRSDEAVSPSLVPDIRQHEADLLTEIEQAKKDAALKSEKAKQAATARLEAAKNALPDTLAALQAQGQAEIQGLVDQALTDERHQIDQLNATAQANMDRAVDRIVRTVVPGGGP